MDLDPECKCDDYYGEWMTCRKCTLSLENDYFEAVLAMRDSISDEYVLRQLRWFAGLSAKDQEASRASIRKMVCERRPNR